MSASRLQTILETRFPVVGTHFSLEHVEPERLLEDPPQMVLRLISWSWERGHRELYDIKEQWVRFPAEHLEHPYLEGFFEGWVIALEEVFGVFKEPTLMPHELFFPEVLDLKRPRNANDYAGALLDSRSRLGRYLPE